MLRWKGGPQPGTTIAIIATDALLDKAQATRLAIAANDGLARALSLTHAPFDGDTIFAAATGRKPLVDPAQDLTALCALAGTVLARAVARGVYEAEALPFEGALPAWRGQVHAGRLRRSSERECRRRDHHSASRHPRNRSRHRRLRRPRGPDGSPSGRSDRIRHRPRP